MDHYWCSGNYRYHFKWGDFDKCYKIKMKGLEAILLQRLVVAQLQGQKLKQEKFRLKVTVIGSKIEL